MFGILWCYMVVYHKNKQWSGWPDDTPAKLKKALCDSCGYCIRLIRSSSHPVPAHAQAVTYKLMRALESVDGGIAILISYCEHSYAILYTRKPTKELCSISRRFCRCHKVASKVRRDLSSWTRTYMLHTGVPNKWFDLVWYCRYLDCLVLFMLHGVLKSGPSVVLTIFCYIVTFLPLWHISTDVFGS